MVIALSAAEHCVGALSQIPVGEGRVFCLPAGGAPADPVPAAGSPDRTDTPGVAAVAVFHLRNGAVHATQAACPHRNGPLADGLIGGTTLICPLHGLKFDLPTGAALTGGCNLTTFPVRVTEAGRIMVTVDTAPPDGGCFTEPP